MKVIVFGATGMVGQAVLRECLLDPETREVLVVGRAPTGKREPKLREIVQSDLFDLTAVADQLSGADACFFCVGVASTGMKEADYRRVTYDLTLSVAAELAELNPDSTFVYVSGMGTDSTEQGRSMWARVKGRTENALLALPLQAYMFRPGYIQPMYGITSRTRMYALMYKVVAPLYPLLKLVLRQSACTTEDLGLAMLRVAKAGAAKRILESRDINELAAQARAAVP